MNTHPAIGKLNSGKFYAFLNGYAQQEFVGSLEEVEVALGVRAAVVTKKPAIKRTARDYIVTMTLPMVIYAGGMCASSEEISVVASTNAEAIKAARQQYRDAEGRHGLTPTFRARLAI